ncbi:DUF5677 domain-containing protein [Erwiniaceae bacterium L1_55_4]|nr:DUF5677 domain-containing protein [Erwiniaceae bacterium L1_55_4]
MNNIIDLKKDAEVALNLNRICETELSILKERMYDSFKSQTQELMVFHYFRILNELCTQAGKMLLAGAYSSAEAQTRVIIEQAANQLYIAGDEGERARALLRSSKQLTKKNGENWIAFLESEGWSNPGAIARKRNGELALADFDERWPNTEKYPNGRRLFEVLGWENHYHAFYAPLCDSVHSYSDDMANLILFYENAELFGDDLEKVLKDAEMERRRLATYNYSIAVGLRAEGLSRICNILDVNIESQQIEHAFEQLQKTIEQHESYDHGRLE